MRPLVPVLLAFLSGIVFSTGLAPAGLPREALYILLAVSFLPAFFFSIKKIRFNYYAAVLPFFFLGALFIFPYLRPELPANHIKNLIDDRGDPSNMRLSRAFGPLGKAVEGVVLYPPDFTGERTRLHVEAKRVLKDGRWEDTTGVILLTVEGQEGRFSTGDHVRFIARLREPMNYGNPGEFDYRGSLNRKGVFVTGYVKNEKLIEKIGGGDYGFRRYVEGLRGGIRNFLERSGVKNREALKALIIAEPRGMDPDVREAFVKTGTVHILVIAGLHVGFVALFSYGFFIFLFKRSEKVMLALNIKKLAAILTVIPVITYGLLAGFPVSTKRAVIMVLAFTLSFLINRGKEFYNTLALAALIILLIYPFSLWEISFQLSFAAVFFIVYLVPRFNGLLGLKEGKAPPGKEGFIRRVFQRKILPAFFVTLAASIGTFPILAYHFHRVSIVGLAANLVAVPIAGLVVPLLLISCSMLPFWETGARFFLSITDAGFEAMVKVIEFFASLPYASVWVSTPTLLEIFFFYALIVCAANVKKRRLYAYLAPLFLIAIILDWGYWNYRGLWSRELKVTFISVGQGESTLVEFPGGKVMLIDGGGQYSSGYDIGERVVAPFLWYKKISDIDYMVLSHTQFDHMAGLKFISGNFGVKEFWWNGDGGLGRLGMILRDAGARVRVVDATEKKLSVGGATVEVLHPYKDLAFDKNNMCLVIKITYGGESFLFTGDIGVDAEGELVKRDIRSIVLKAPHHGSRYSSTPGFLKKVSPSIVVISAGRGNVFGFPHRETLEKYNLMGARVFRTDVNGAVTITTDGKNISTNAYLTDDYPWSIL